MDFGTELVVGVLAVTALWLVMWSCLEQAKIADEKWDTMMQIEQWPDAEIEEEEING